MSRRDHPEKNVYIIEHPHGYVKIGVSKQPVARLSNLQTGTPYELDLVGEIQTDDPFGVEANLHEKYESQQVDGEWYDLSTRQRAHLIELTDLNKEAVRRRYAQSTEERRKRTLKIQGLIG